MLCLGGMAGSAAEAHERVTDGLKRGVGLAKLREIVAAQGGDPSPVDDPSLLPTAPVLLDVTAKYDGYIAGVEPMAVALTANRLGAGRARKGDPIDHGVGLEILCTVGQRVAAGETVARVHARDAAGAESAVRAIRSAIVVGADRPDEHHVVLERISTQQ
jgi:thymidine phosphorylase